MTLGLNDRLPKNPEFGFFSGMKIEEVIRRSWRTIRLLEFEYNLSFDHSVMSIIEDYEESEGS